jgi:hypothetical protein
MENVEIMEVVWCVLYLCVIATVKRHSAIKSQIFSTIWNLNTPPSQALRTTRITNRLLYKPSAFREFLGLRCEPDPVYEPLIHKN